MDTPNSLRTTLNLSVVRRLLARKKQTEADLHNVCKTLFQPGTKVQYRINTRDYFGSVIEVIGLAGRTQVRVQNLSTLKRRDIRLEDITGIVQED